MRELCLTTVGNLSPKAYKQLSRLNYRERGEMEFLIKNARRWEKDTPVAYIVDGDKILSWGMLTYTHIDNQFFGNFYTRKANRRQGLGSKVYEVLIRVCNLRHKKLKVAPHSDASEDFFNANEDKRWQW